MILIVSKLDDLHARHLQTHLSALGHQTSILDLSELGQTRSIEHHIGYRDEVRFLSSDGEAIESKHVRVVWLRRPARPEVSRMLLSPVDQNFASREWAQALDGLLLSMNAVFVNPLAAQRMVAKPLQLRRARQIGLKVPNTLVTSDVEAARAFISRHKGRVIHKSMTPHPSEPLFTRRWQTAHADHLDTLHRAPVIFQEEVAAECDIRVTIVGAKLFAARMVSLPDTPDSRLDPDSPFEPCELPDAVADKCLALVHNLGLVFGCIDLRFTKEDGYTFLEINPQGQFLYIEIWTGLPISTTLAAYLASYDQ